MCNNWLNYAHAYAFGREYGVKTISMRFAYKYRYFHICQQPWHTPLVYVLAKYATKVGLTRYIDVENPLNMNQEVVETCKRCRFVTLYGWFFRFPELFKKYHEEIAQLFAFQEKSIKKESRWLEELTPADIRLGVHIRRGDYATWMEGKYFFSDEVFINRIKHFRELFPGKKVQVIICTNDKKLDINKYRKGCDLQDIYINRGNEIEDLYALSTCQYLIGPMSTYSLVAAFYNGAKIHWIKSAEETPKLSDFKGFYDLFMEV